eukprot:Em1007g1a
MVVGVLKHRQTFLDLRRALQLDQMLQVPRATLALYGRLNLVLVRAKPELCCPVRWQLDGSWICMNIALFIYQFYNFTVLPRYFYSRVVLREALSFARGPAIIINFNIILILLPVCRNLISLLRGTGRDSQRVLDKNLTFHKAVAWMIIAASAMHIMAHYYNYERIAAIVRVGPLVPTEGPRPPLQALPVASVPPGTPLDPIAVCLVTVAGLTGHVITVALFLMVTSSLEFM